MQEIQLACESQVWSVWGGDSNQLQIAFSKSLCLANRQFMKAVPLVMTIGHVNT